MTTPRAALTRQDLPKLLSILKAAGASEARFFRDGRLASVRLGTPEPPAEKPGKAEPPAPDRWDEHKRALRVLQGGGEDLDGEKLL